MAGLIWWVVAWRLVAADQRRKNEVPETASRRTLSVFKPVPFLGAQGLKVVAAGLESFVAQLDPSSELLLGIHEADRDFVEPFLDRLRTDYPDARLKVFFRSGPDETANPKIAWQKILAPEAEGELWLWSDADVIAPAGFLQSARLEYARSGAAMMTFPYVVRAISSGPALLEAIFVNVEFYPGVLLLRRMGPVDFGLGSAMLFQRDDFLREVDWSEIGAWLADDFFLGQKLRPVRIGTTTLATVPGSFTCGQALLHDLRWTKTIRWNRPVGSFARILVMPVLGWLGAVALHPHHIFAWVGLLGMIQAEVLFAAAICRRAGCELTAGTILGMEGWTLWRILLWFLSWLPWPVIWSGKIWRGPRVESNREDEPAKNLVEAVDNHVRKTDLFKFEGLKGDIALFRNGKEEGDPMTLLPSSTHRFSSVGHDHGALEESAGALRDEVFGRTVFVRGVIEVSNFCRQNCKYCGMRRDNHELKRFRVELESLRDLVRHGIPDVVTDLNIQTGEDTVGDREIVLPLIETIRKEKPHLGISVCLGTLDYKLYDQLQQAGASYYIIKLETGNRDHYREVQAPGNLDQRLAAIRYLAESGWSVSSGFILGLPGQTPAQIEESLELLGALPLVGASVSPFIAGEQTPFANQPSGDFEKTIECIARLRLRNPSYIIPAISALNLVNEDGYVRALRAGANLATINLTPANNRNDYLLYKRNRFIMHEQRVKDAIEQAGCAISTVSVAETLRQKKSQVAEA